jgi:release factor glutamine methyltransferase
LTVGELLAEGRKALERAAIESASVDARILLAHAATLSQAAVIAATGEEVSAAARKRFLGFIERRSAGEPVSRIIGRREFFGMEFSLGLATLDPRPETELLVEAAIADHASVAGPLRFADVGTGSGAIAIAILAHLPHAIAVATDTSEEALAVARQNAAVHGVIDRLTFVHTDILEGCAGDFDFIVANPPYIPSADIPGLAAEVRLFDPHSALDGGADGLEIIRAVVAAAHDRLRPGGRLYLEFGIGQARAVRDIAILHGLEVYAIRPDLSGIPRMLTARRADAIVS